MRNNDQILSFFRLLMWIQDEKSVILIKESDNLRKDGMLGNSRVISIPLSRLNGFNWTILIHLWSNLEFSDAKNTIVTVLATAMTL